MIIQGGEANLRTMREMRMIFILLTYDFPLHTA